MSASQEAHELLMKYYQNGYGGIQLNPILAEFHKNRSTSEKHLRHFFR